METASAAPAAAPSSPAPSTPSPAPSSPAAPAAGASQSPSGGSPTPAAATPSAEPRRLKVKVDGVEQEIDEQEAIRGYQSRAAVARRFEEFARAKKEFEAQQAAAKKRLEDPRVVQAAQEWGIPPEDAAAVIRAQELMQREQMSPDQRALQDERQRREEAERRIKEQEEAGKQAQLDAATQQAQAQINREVVAAAEKVGLPKSPRIGRMMLQHMKTMADAGQGFDPAESARFVMDSLKVEVPHLIGGMNDEQLVAFLGKPVVDRILARSVALARGQATGAGPTPNPGPAPTPQPKRYLSTEEWREAMNK